MEPIMKKLLSLCLIFALLSCLGVAAYATSVESSARLTAGVSSSCTIYECPEGLTIAYGPAVTSGDLPSGVNYVVTNSKSIGLTGVPALEGSYPFTLSLITLDAAGVEDSVDIYVTAYVEPGAVVPSTPVESPVVSPASGLPAITKDPTGESVYNKGRAVFIARADNADSITWYVRSPSGDVYPASNLPGLFGVSVTGVNEEKFVITNANPQMTGFTAYAVFTNALGSVSSSTAPLTVSKDLEPTPTPIPTPISVKTPAPTTSPVSTPAPSATVKPESTPTPAVITPNPTPTPSSLPVISADNDGGNSARQHGNRGFTIALIAIVGLITVACAAVLILYMRGVISLEWLENRLNGSIEKKANKRSSRPKEEDLPDPAKPKHSSLDLDGDLYNPDDYK